MIDPYLLHLGILILIFIVLAISLQITIGFTGLLNLGHVAFYGIGAYTSVLLVMQGYPFWFGLIGGGIVALVFGLLLAVVTNKLKGDYLALATLGFTFLVSAVLINWTDLTRGPLGIPGIPKPELFGFVFSSSFEIFVLYLVITLISVGVMYKIVSSRFGKVLGAIRDDELATRVLGKNTFKMKAYSLAIGSFFAGIAGSMYAHYISFIDPTTFSILELLIMFTIVIIGGMASFRGTIIATIIIILLPEPLRFIGFPSAVVGPARLMVFASLLLLILIYRPKGLFGKINFEVKNA